MYSAQRELELRHYDIKLLNFFLMRPEARLPPQQKQQLKTASAASAVGVQYGCFGHEHRFTLPTDEPSLVLLADFGTSDISPESLGRPINKQHFTTHENVPPDFLLLGSQARQGFKVDAFALGLCWLHLLTGKAPYEELLEPLTCPVDLRASLNSVWRAEGAGPYEPIRKLIGDDDDEKDSVLHDTLYRFVCLFGAPDEASTPPTSSDDKGGDDGDGDDDVCDSDAWRAVRAWLDTPAGKSRYGKDRAQWSAFSGKNKALVEAQRRMAKLPGSEEMLRGLVDFRPSRRWSVRRALSARLFESYRCDASSPVPENTLRYTAYLED
jgi:serine/threonine protein kinase